MLGPSSDVDETDSRGTLTGRRRLFLLAGVVVAIAVVAVPATAFLAGGGSPGAADPPRVR